MKRKITNIEQERLSEQATEYRKLAKRANQRLVRLERLDTQVGSNALEAAHYILGREGRKRWSENPKNMTEEEIIRAMKQVSDFLNDETSKASEVKKQDKLYKDFVAKNDILKDLNEYDKQAVQNETRKARLLEAAGETSSSLSGSDFMRAFRVFNRLGLDKKFDYRTLATALAQNKSQKIETVVAKIVSVSQEQKLTRKKFLKRFEDAGYVD